jgi:hypothetical protein
MASVSGDENGEGKVMRCSVFGWQNGEKARWLHGARGR